MKNIFISLLLLISLNAFAHSDSHEDEGGKVGEDKGILEAHGDEGIKLSPEALKNFEIKTIALKGKGPWGVPTSAKFQSGEEVNVFRLRDSFFRRIDFEIAKNEKLQMIIRSDDLKEGDQVVIAGIGFLRIAEISAFGGTPDEH